MARVKQIFDTNKPRFHASDAQATHCNIQRHQVIHDCRLRDRFVVVSTGISAA